MTSQKELISFIGDYEFQPRPQNWIPVPFRVCSFSSSEPPFLLDTWSAILKRVALGSRIEFPFKIADAYSCQFYIEVSPTGTGCRVGKMSKSWPGPNFKSNTEEDPGEGFWELQPHL